MGRFATTVEFYARCREPYPPAFFHAIAERLALQGDEPLLDIGCGPAPLAIGLAPYVGSCLGIDAEPAMLEAAQAAARSAGVALALHLGNMEEFTTSHRFAVITIGRALHWLERVEALEALERMVEQQGWILVCGATSIETAATPWLKPYLDACNRWSDDPERKRYRVKPQEWFAGSPFMEMGNIAVTHAHRVSLDDLIGRALSKSNTSLAVLGDRLEEFESRVRAVLAPFAQDGFVEEEVSARAAIFGRPG